MAGEALGDRVMEASRLLVASRVVWTVDAINLVKARSTSDRALLLDIDPSLGRGLEGSDFEEARSQLIMPTGHLEQGSWAPPTQAPPGAELGLLVTDGALIRQVRVDRGHASELLGDGDLIRPWQEDSASFCESCWRVLEPTGVAILTSQGLKAMCRWPTIVTALIERAIGRSRWLVAQSAITHVVGVEKIVLTMLWHISEKWGRIDDGRVVITVPMTHDLIAEMAGASRTYVTEALGALADRGEVSRDCDGLFVLHGEPPGNAFAP